MIPKCKVVKNEHKHLVYVQNREDKSQKHKQLENEFKRGREGDRERAEAKTLLEFTSWSCCELSPITFHCNSNRALCLSSYHYKQKKNNIIIL